LLAVQHAHPQQPQPQQNTTVASGEGPRAASLSDKLRKESAQQKTNCASSQETGQLLLSHNQLAGVYLLLSCKHAINCFSASTLTKQQRCKQVNSSFPDSNTTTDKPPNPTTTTRKQ
jgi:hypothetical protein